jgi:hypothetical protein
VPPTSARTTADPHDSARFRIAHSLFHQLIIVSSCSVLWRGAPGLSWSFHLSQLQLLNSQVLQRPLDAKPTKWLTFRPALTVRILSLSLNHAVPLDPSWWVRGTVGPSGFQTFKHSGSAAPGVELGPESLQKPAYLLDRADRLPGIHQVKGFRLCCLASSARAQIPQLQPQRTPREHPAGPPPGDTSARCYVSSCSQERLRAESTDPPARGVRQ